MVKRRGAKWTQRLAVPMASIGLFFVRRFYVPVYRLSFFLRRYTQKVLLPAKHRLVFVISNRYTTHVLMMLIVVGVTWVNMSARDVRAEAFGQRSLLYQLVSEDDSGVLEVVDADSPVVAFGKDSSYLAGTTLDAHRHIDLDYLDAIAQPTTGSVPSTTSTTPTRTRTEIETYVVGDGDTLGKIAQLHSLSLSTILWSNGLTYTSTIRPGQELKILPIDGVLYEVKSGDTLSKISKSFSVDGDVIMEQNNLASANALSIGTQLLLPGGAPPSPVTTTRASASITSLFVAPAVTAPSVQVDGWVWPTDWKIITQYYGWRHTGLDIDGDYHTFSYASRGGVVTYSGWRAGYGLTVEIDHGDGYMTRYAHHSKNYVGVGEVVSTGQAIAQTGTTGRSTGTHLHFEIIRNGKFQNPLDYVR